MRLTPQVLVLVAAAALSAAGSAGAQQAPTRSPELAALQGLVGVFEGEVRIEIPGAQPITGRMRFEADWELDSAWVVARYSQTIRGNTTSGLLMYSWDAKALRYTFYGFSNAPMPPHRLAGAFDGATFTFESDPSSGGHALRETWRRVGPDTLVTALAGRQGDAWVTGPRTVLVRVPAGSPGRRH